MSYQHVKLSNSKIRLLTLLPARHVDPLYAEIIEREFPPETDDDTTYEALSYVWGDQTLARPLYIVDGGGILCGTLDLGKNLYSALQHLRFEKSRRVLWCDLICINQFDLQEREREVARMASIYSSARRAIVWLGPEEDDSALALRTMDYTGLQVQIDPQLRTWKPIPDADPRFSWNAEDAPYSQQELEAIKHLVARSWFKRLWVRQEVALAKSAVVVVGNHDIPWKHFVSAVGFLDTFVRLRGNTDTEFGQNLFNIFECGCLEEYKGIMEILHACRACDCSEDHDRVYAILGLLSSHQNLVIKPDYSKLAKNVYRDLVMEFYNQHQRLDILTLCEEAEPPTWVPDLHKLSLDSGINTRVVPYCWASGAAAASLVVLEDNAIEVHGVNCGTLGKRIPPSVDKNSDAVVLRHEIVQILVSHMGNLVSQWDPNRFLIITKGLLGSLWFERTGRRNHASLEFALSELKLWVLEDENGMAENVSSGYKRLTLVNHISRVIFHSDSCQWTQDGHLGLGLSACREGDVLYAILGCRRLMALRKDPGRHTFRIVGKFDHPGFNDGEALLGELRPGWGLHYRHLLLASNRPRFVHDDGTSQWQDPRLQDIALPEGWNEGEDDNGIPYWFESERPDSFSYSDPRLTCEQLQRRGSKVDRLFIT